MASYSCAQPARHGGFFIFLLLAVAAVAAGLYLVAIPHPDRVHPIDAPQTRTCLENYGTWKVFQESDGTIHLLCQYPGNPKVFDRIMKWIDDQWREATAFSPKDGTWLEVRDWLLRKPGKFIPKVPDGMPGLPLK